MKPAVGNPVWRPAGPVPAPPGYDQTGAWRGFWSQVEPPAPGHEGLSEDGYGGGDPAGLPGRTGLTEPMPMISPAPVPAPPAFPAARPRLIGPTSAPAPRPEPAAAPPWAEAYAVPVAVGPPAPPAPPAGEPPAPAPVRPETPPAPPAQAGPPAQTAPPVRPAPPRRAAGRRGRGKQPRWGAGYPLALAGMAAGLAYLWRGPQFVRGGVLAVAVTLLLAAAARLVLPERRAGLLASRRRLADVAAYSILGLALLVASLVLPPQS